MKRIIDKINKRAKVHTVLRYIISGGTAFVIEYAIFMWLFYFIMTTAIAANAVSFVCGLATSFVLNKLWVFAAEKQGRQTYKQLALYVTLALFNLVATSVLIAISTDAGIPAYIAKILLIMLVAIWNFFIFRTIIFKVEA